MSERGERSGRQCLIEENLRFQLIRGGTTPFDLVIEFFWPDGQTCREGTARPQALAMARRLDTLDAWLDQTRTTLTYVQD